MNMGEGMGWAIGFEMDWGVELVMGGMRYPPSVPRAHATYKKEMDINPANMKSEKKEREIQKARQERNSSMCYRWTC